MGTFGELALLCSGIDTQDIDTSLILDDIGDVQVTELTSEALGSLFSSLYDSMGVKGRVYGKYRNYVNRVLHFCVENGFIANAPDIPQRAQKKPYQFNRPDANSLNRYLALNENTAASTIIHLSWNCGLKRKEISALKWEQVDFYGRQLLLDDRCIPLQASTLEYLENACMENRSNSEYVLISNSGKAPVEEHNLSVIIRRVLNDLGQPSVRLSDLRFDYIAALLNSNDWKYVSYTAGIDLASIQQHFLPYVNKSSLRITEKGELSSSEAQQLSALIDSEGASSAGIALRLISEAGIPAALLPALKWDVIDFKSARMSFDDRVIKISSDTLDILKKAYEQRENKLDNIFLTDTGNSVDLPYLMRLISKTLVRNGLVTVNVASLCSYYWKSNPESIVRYKQLNSNVVNYENRSAPITFPSTFNLPDTDEIVSYVRLCGCLSISGIAAEFELSTQEAKKAVEKCRREGKLELIGTKYYPSNCVVPTARHKEIIVEYISSNQPVTHSELARLLGLKDSRQVLPILNRLIKSGDIIKTSADKYYLS